MTGRIESRSYETKDGQKRTAEEIVASEIRFLDRKKDRVEEDEFDPNIDDPPF